MGFTDDNWIDPADNDNILSDPVFRPIDAVKLEYIWGQLQQYRQAQKIKYESDNAVSKETEDPKKEETHKKQ